MPGQDILTQTIFFDFQKAGDSSRDTYVYLAGDCVDFNAGWIEGGLRTAVNAASAVITSLGGTLNDIGGTLTTPMTMQADRYNYFVTS